jgi:hypothetical protein
MGFAREHSMNALDLDCGCRDQAGPDDDRPARTAFGKIAARKPILWSNHKYRLTSMWYDHEIDDRCPIPGVAVCRGVLGALSSCLRIGIIRPRTIDHAMANVTERISICPHTGLQRILENKEE